MRASELESGESYQRTVDRVSQNGNGVIELEQSHLVLGSIKSSAVGEDVEFEFLGGNLAKCLTEEHVPQGYDPVEEYLEKKNAPEIYDRSISDNDNKNKLLKGIR